MLDSFLSIFGSDSTKLKIKEKQNEKKLKQEIEIWKSKLQNNDLLMQLLNDISKEKIDNAVSENNKYNYTRFDNKILKYEVFYDHIYSPWVNKNSKRELYYNEFGYDRLPSEAAMTVFAASIFNELNRYDNNKWMIEKLWWSDSGSYGLGKGGNGIVYSPSERILRGFSIYKLSDAEHKDW